MKETISIHHDLVEACKNFDRKAQFKIYKLYYKAMYNTSVRIIKDDHLAEDIMQESFLSAFENIKSFSGQVTFGAWLKRIVINRSIDYLKKQKLEITEINDDYSNIVMEETVEEDRSFDFRRVNDAINQLADGYRLVLSLYLLEGYDHEEIGEILGITASTSRSQFTRAKKKLLQILN